jgi:hypothetical protein
VSDKPTAPSHAVASHASAIPPAPVPAIIDELFKRIIGPLAATGIATLLHEPDHIDERVGLLVKTFDENSSLISPFRALVKSLNKQESEVALEEQIRFFTTKHTRNWLIVNLMNNVLQIKELQLDHATGRLPAKPVDLIKYANKAQADLGEEGRYKEIAFISGLLFDFLFYLQRTTLLDIGQARFDEPINQLFTQSLDQAKLIMKLSRHKSKLTLERFTPVTSFMRQLSQICLVLLRPNEAPDFYKKLATIKHTEGVRLAMEMQAFQVHTGIISAYLAQSLKPLDHLGEAMSVWGFPYLSWVHGKRDVHDLTGMGLLGIAMAEGLKGNAFPGDGTPAHALPELEYLDFKVTAEVKSEAKI